MKKEVEPRLYIVRFSNGTMMSSFGTKDQVIEVAELKKDSYGGGYIIV